MREIAEKTAIIQSQSMFKVIDKVKRLEFQGRNIVHLKIGDLTAQVRVCARAVLPSGVEDACKRRLGARDLCSIWTKRPRM
jgi:hypothetical protein